MASENIIEKIQKLLALGESPNIHEAELAMAKAAELMKRHNLEMADLLAQVTASDMICDREYMENRRKTWISTLAFACARLFDGSLVRLTTMHHCRPGNCHAWVGTRDNVLAAKLLFQYLLRSWESIAKHDFAEHRKERKEAGRTHTGRGTFRNAHGTGFAHAIATRVDEILKERKAEMNGTPGALVPVNMAVAVKDKIREEFGRTTRSNARRSTGTGYNAGHNAGSGISLNGAIGSGRYLN